MSFLEVRGLSAYYGQFQALFDVSLDLDRGEVVALIGSNGSGKSTFLKSVAGLVSPLDGEILLDNVSLIGARPHQICQRGVALVPEGRRIFPSLSVKENLLLGATVRRAGDWSIDRVFEVFPALRERASTLGTALSGGQQQMLAIGRALMSNPDVLLCDEMSLGLAPKIVGEIYEVLGQIADTGSALIVVDQDVQKVRQAANRIYCLREGRVVLAAESQSVSLSDVTDAFFGAD